MSAPRLLAALALAALATPAAAQQAGHSMVDMPGMDHSSMPGMDHGTMDHAAKTKVPPRRKAAAKPAAQPTGHNMADMPGMDHSAMPGMDHSAMPGMDHRAMADMPGIDHSSMAGMDHAAMGRAAAGTALPAGDAPAPAAPAPTYADRIWGREAMESSRNQLRREHGGMAFSQVNVNLLEYQAGSGARWDGEGWYGTDLDRLFVKSEGRTERNGTVKDAELQVLYGRTIGPYTFLQAGVRQDFAPRGRTYASVGVETIAPYWVDMEGTLFLSTKGDLLARAEAWYDLRVTQRLVLQPRAEFNLAAQDVRETGTGAGLSDVELGLRLRYEIRREFAPYIGVSYDRDVGQTARFTRGRGEDVGATRFVIGLRSWF